MMYCNERSIAALVDSIEARYKLEIKKASRKAGEGVLHYKRV